jgi:nucleotide-binding universal stress UspA family protein
MLVVGYDGRWQADRLLVAAAHEALRRDLDLAIVTVVQAPRDSDPYAWDGVAATGRLLAGAGDALARRFPRLRVSTHCLPYAELGADLEPFRSAELLMVGARDLHGHLAFGPDTPSGALLSMTSCPVLAVPDAALGETPQLGQGLVVVGLSGTLADEGVGAIAAREAEQRDASVLFLHAVTPEPGEALAAAVARSSEAIRPMLPAGVLTDGKVSLTFTLESPVSALVRASRNAHIVVLGARPGSLRGEVLGSVSRRVLAAVDVPTLVVPARVGALVATAGAA